MSLYFHGGIALHECPGLQIVTTYPVPPHLDACCICGEDLRQKQPETTEASTDNTDPKETA